MAGPSRLKLVGLVEGMCPNVLAQEFFRSVNCEPWGYVALHVALVRHIYLIIIINNIIIIIIIFIIIIIQMQIQIPNNCRRRAKVACCYSAHFSHKSLHGFFCHTRIHPFNTDKH